MRARLQSLGFWPLAALSTTATLLMALGAPPDGLTWLIWLGFVPLTLVARVSAERSPRRIFLLGWFGGLCSGLVGFPWIGETLERFAGLPAPVAWFGLLLFASWTAIPFGFWAWGVSRGPDRGWRAIAWPLVLWAALAHLWPSLFPYTVVIGFAEAPVWIQAAELGGLTLVVAQVVLVGVLLADAILQPGGEPGTRRARTIRVAIAAAIPLVSGTLGDLRLRQIDAEQADARHVRFGVVQPNAALGSVDNFDRMLRLRMMSTAAADGGAQILVWPEAGSFPFRTPRPFERDFPDAARSVLRGHGLPTIFGAGSYERGVRWERNTVYAMASDGTVTGFFDKVILVPFGEYVPLVDPAWAIRHVPSMSHNLAGEGPARLVVEPAPRREPFTRPPSDAPAEEPIALGPLICYEDIFPGFAHDVARQDGGIDAFVNVTIDTWFGMTAEPWEHLALAQFRSVEHRIPMVRSVAAGVSTVVDAGGRVVAYLPVRGPTVEQPVPPEYFVYDVALPRNTAQQPTIFARVGWLLPWLCSGFVLGVVLLAAVRWGRRRRVSPDSASAGTDHLAAASTGSDPDPA